MISSFKLFFSFSPIVIVETMYSQPGVRYFISGLGEKLASSESLLIKFQSINQPTDPVSIKLQERTLLLRYLPILLGFLCALLVQIKFIAYIFLKNKSHHNFKLKVFSVDVTNEFNDVMDISLGSNWIVNQQKIKIVRRALLEISYAYFIILVISLFKRRIKFVITGDSAYRYGFFVKVAKLFNIPVISNLNLNSLFMNLISSKTANGAQGEKITLSDCERVVTLYPNWENEILEYYTRRFSGKIVQHDVLNAYSPLKKINDSFISDLKNRKQDKELLIVTIFAHVFSDAPRNTPGMIFFDFRDWFISTVNSLSRNRNVLICLKEHPSSHLYDENDLMRNIINDLNLQSKVFFWGSEPTDFVIKSSDLVITCSGTVGLEAAYLEKPVLIASECFYSGLGLCHEFKSRLEYLNFIQNLSCELSLPITYQHSIAMLVGYVHFVIFSNRDLYPDFPLPAFLRGVPFGIDDGPDLFNKVVNYISIDTKFSNDLSLFLEGSEARFIPKLNCDER
jgi:hypothetical protein